MGYSPNLGVWLPISVSLIPWGLRGHKPQLRWAQFSSTCKSLVDTERLNIRHKKKDYVYFVTICNKVLTEKLMFSLYFWLILELTWLEVSISFQRTFVWLPTDQLLTPYSAVSERCTGFGQACISTSLQAYPFGRRWGRCIGFRKLAHNSNRY